MENNIESLTNFNVSSLNKNQLLTKTKELQKVLKDYVNKAMQGNPGMDLLYRLEKIETQMNKNDATISKLKEENVTLKKRVKELEDYSYETEDNLIKIEKSLNKCDQFTRRENFELSGIPQNIPQDELEDKVLGIINTITERNDNSAITANDIHACHRLKKEEGEVNPKVIVRMVNRKNTVDIFRNKKKLKEKATDLGFQNLFNNENLCPENKSILDQARNLKKKGILHVCWTYNGVVNIKINENSRPKKIFHMSYYESFFDNKQLEWD